MDSRRRTRILIADDHNLVAEACGRLLEPEFEVAGIVNNGRTLIEAATQLKPDIVILDVGMPELNGIDAGDQLKRSMPSIKLLYLTVNTAPEVAAEAFRHGASGYIVKQCAASELVTAVHRVLKGESYLSPLVTKDIVDFLLRSGTTLSEDKQITARQREVLQLLAEGMSMKQVASVLNLKPGTVAFHKYRIMQTLGLKSNAELLHYAIRHHLIET
jgi:DNA-binding NarL/FixJ family response regulator